MSTHAVHHAILESRPRPTLWICLGVAALLAGCSGRNFSPDGSTEDGGRDGAVPDLGSDTGQPDVIVSPDVVTPVDGPQPDVNRPDIGPDVRPPGRVPLEHRATATACDSDRPPVNASPDSPGGPPVDCGSDADCVEGINGRCVGNGHDGYYCNYDECFTDADCGDGGVCQCGGGFRSDNNVCLRQGGGCRTDADCGAEGYCSPTFGSCGDYSGVVGYACHTPADTCIDDADCAGFGSSQFGGEPYCAFSEETGLWQCSDSQCAG